MTSRISEVAIACADLDAQAAFWTAALGYAVGETEDGYTELVPPPELRGAPTIGLGRVPEAKTVKNRLHLDLVATDRSQEEEVERLCALGARRVEIGQSTGTPVSWVVLADPEGNEFCVLRSRSDPPA